jgi:N-glycosidase YbiA
LGKSEETGMETRALESMAFFEEKVAITPRDFAEDKIKIDDILSQKLSQKLEGKCSLHGWVVPGTLRILSRSMGYVESGRYTGDIVYHVQTQGLVINPPSGAIVTGQVIRKNKMGMYVDYKNAIRIILPRDLHIGEESYEVVEVGQYVECVIKKSRFQVNDEYILSVGDFLNVSEKGKKPRTQMRPPIKQVEEEQEEKKEETKEEDLVVDAAPLQVQEQEGGEAGPSIPMSEEAGPIEFSSKSASYNELSNFHKSKFLLDGKEWPTVEHYFQAQKFPTSPEYQEKIRGASEPNRAKTFGASKEFPIRNDWDSYREEVMRKALKAKFEQNPNLKTLLLSTTGRPLVEDTSDAYWGQGRNKKGKNRLGLLLMELRDSLQQ